MQLSQFSAVRLTTDRFRDEGVARGALGFVLDIFDDGYDVEFSRPKDGSAIALLFLKATDVEPAPEVALRPVHASL